MPTKLVTTNVWSRITRAAKASPSRAHVAVAYFGSNGSQLLPLKSGSRLVVDMSRAAVSSGQTNPSEVLKLIYGGVDVYSVPNLHAKVFVFGQRAFVGSANVSRNSATGLVEAVVETTTPAVVNAARRFVREQSFRLVTPQYAQRMAKFYKPPKFAAPQRRNIDASLPQAPVVHVLQLKHVTQSDEEQRFAQKELVVARRKRAKPRSCFVDYFQLQGRVRLDVEDVVVQVTDEGDGRKMVSPHGNVIRVSRYQKGRRASAFVYVEIPKKLRRKNLKAVVKRLGHQAKDYLNKDRVVRDGAFVRSLLGLWQTDSGKNVA